MDRRAALKNPGGWGNALLKGIFEVVLGRLLLACALLVLAWLAVLDTLGFAGGRTARRNLRREPTPASGMETIGEFSFERAIPAYEELIDTVAGERRS